LRQICHATRYVVAQGLCWLFWCLKYAVILPLATMALLALLVLWKDNTTPGKLLVQEIEFVRGRTPAGLYPVRYCSNSFGSDLAMPPSVTCGFRRGDAAEYARETDQSLMQLFTGALCDGVQSQPGSETGRSAAEGDAERRGFPGCPHDTV
ncbi:conjugal transfer protein TraP, partial [Escherichia coli]|uniref:conjugal transfer protein TraP n=1 Tax=Escherichia coli TaxID=562 RepID=UPI003DA894CB